MFFMRLHAKIKYIFRIRFRAQYNRNDVQYHCITKSTYFMDKNLIALIKTWTINRRHKTASKIARFREIACKRLIRRYRLEIVNDIRAKRIRAQGRWLAHSVLILFINRKYRFVPKHNLNTAKIKSLTSDN